MALRHMTASLREVQKDEADVRLVMEWRHDPMTREMSFDGSLRPFAEFWAEFVDRYPGAGAPKPVFMEVDGRPVAYLGFGAPRDTEHAGEDSIEISINVDPARRERGHGLRALRLAEPYLSGFGYRSIVALVKTTNAVSRRLFERAGYVDTGRSWIAPPDGTAPVETIRYVRRIPEAA